tara:strand:+ start:191 stop:2083 length:1893 start_codon:yes stop_codon:yes gene_type:complete
VTDRNVILPVTARDFSQYGAPPGSKFKIIFRKDQPDYLKDYSGTKFYKSETAANNALTKRSKLIADTKTAKLKPPTPAKADKFLVKVGSPTKTNNVIKQKFKEVIGSKNVPSTYKPTGVTKDLYRASIQVGNKTVLSTEFGSKADAVAAVKDYRKTNPIKNPPPDLKTLDERKKKRYLDKKIRQSDIAAKGGIPEGGVFKGDPQIHKGHAGNIKGTQLITGDKVIRTPAIINQMMAGEAGDVAKTRFTDLDFKIRKAEEKITDIKNSNKSITKKQKLLAAEDDKLIQYAAQSDGYKVVKLSDGKEFRLPGKSLQTIDPFDDYPGMTEVEINKELRKYFTVDNKLKPNWAKQIADGTIKIEDVEAIKKGGIFMENMNLSKDVAKNNLENIKTIYANEPDGSAFRKAMEKRVNCADGCFLKVANKNPERIAKLLSTGQVIKASELPRPDDAIRRDMFKETNIRWNNDIGAFVTPNEDIASQADIKKYIAENPIEVKAGETPLKPATNKSVLANVGRTMAAVGAPLPTALIDSYFIGQQVKQGKGTAEIASNPLNWLGLATMEPLTKAAGIAEGDGLKKVLRLGLNPATIRGISRFAGLPGLAISTAMTAYDQYEKYKDGEGFIYKLFNKEGT